MKKRKEELKNLEKEVNEILENLKEGDLLYEETENPEHLKNVISENVPGIKQIDETKC